MRRFLERHLDDVLVISGAGLVVYGAFLLSVVAAVFVAGGFLIAFGVLVGMGAGRGGSSL